MQSFGKGTTNWLHGAGYFLIGGGCVLLGLRHVIYDFLSIVIANIAIIMGVVLIYRGLFRFLGITLRHERWLSTTLVVLLAALLYFYTFHIPDINIRIQAFSMVCAAICLIGASGLLKHRDIRNRMVAKMLIAMFLLMSSLFIFRFSGRSTPYRLKIS